MIACAGPLVNFLFIVFFMISNQNVILIYDNIIIFVFNMLTIYPLDGGRILKYILCIIFGKQKSLKLTYIISNITAIILTIIVIYISVLLKNIILNFSIFYIWIVLYTENKKYKIKKEMYKILENYIAINED